MPGGLQNPRKHGSAPYGIAVLHGGPGAYGSVAPVARELSGIGGTLEPFQTAESIDGQVAELAGILQQHARLPVALVGHSWGAWLAVLFAARYPEMVRKLVLVGSGPFEAGYAGQIMPTRLSRISPDRRERFDELMRLLHSPDTAGREAVVEELGSMLGPTDTFDPLPPCPEDKEMELPFRPGGFTELMEEAQRMRRDGELLRLAGQVRCPVTAIHGDYDPHPADGVRKPLERLLPGFRFILLENCGHEPWRERRARERFYEALRQELV